MEYQTQINYLTPAILSSFLKKHAGGQRGIERLKTVYRPYICPLHAILPLFQPQGISVFDIGCGGGGVIKLLNEFCSPSRLYGIDINDTVIGKAKQFLDDIEKPCHVQVYDGQSLPDTVSEFDFVTMIDVLHHIPEKSKLSFLKNLFGKMKTGAKLVLKDIDADFRFFLIFNKLHDYLLSGETGSELSLNKTIELLQKTGFSVEKIMSNRMLCYAHFTLVAQKESQN